MLEPKMAATSVVSVALFVGVAVAAAGGVAALLSDAALITLVAVTVAMLVAALFTKASLSSGVREDRSNRWVIGALGVLGFVGAVAPPLCWRFGWLTFGGEALRWTGVVLYALGGALRLAPVYALGRRFSGLVAIQPGHQLLTSGLYAHIRHPSYLGLLVLSLGWALAFDSAVGVVSVALTLIPLVARMNSEEKLLAQHFGGEYEAYRARTARLLPGVY